MEIPCPFVPKLGPVVPGGSALCWRPHLREIRIETSETFGKLLSSTNPNVLGPRLAIIASTCFLELVWWVQHIVSLGSTESCSAWPISGLSNSMVGTSFNWQANLDEGLYGRMSLVHIDALPWGKQTQDTTGTQALAPIGKVTLGGRPPCRMHRMFMAPTHVKPGNPCKSLSISAYLSFKQKFENWFLSGSGKWAHWHPQGGSKSLGTVEFCWHCRASSAPKIIAPEHTPETTQLSKLETSTAWLCAQCDLMTHLPAALFLSDLAWSSLPSLQECSIYHDKMRQARVWSRTQKQTRKRLVRVDLLEHTLCSWLQFSGSVQIDPPAHQLTILLLTLAGVKPGSWKKLSPNCQQKSQPENRQQNKNPLQMCQVSPHPHISSPLQLGCLVSQQVAKSAICTLAVQTWPRSICIES